MNEENQGHFDLDPPPLFASFALCFAKISIRLKEIAERRETARKTTLEGFKTSFNHRT